MEISQKEMRELMELLGRMVDYAEIAMSMDPWDESGGCGAVKADAARAREWKLRISRMIERGEV